jgi:hypothetical protein
LSKIILALPYRQRDRPRAYSKARRLIFSGASSCPPTTETIAHPRSEFKLQLAFSSKMAQLQDLRAGLELPAGRGWDIRAAPSTPSALNDDENM